MPTHRSQPSLSDVARDAGVSLSTASRALNGSSRAVRNESRARVLASAQRLGYVANAPAQAVARGISTGLFLVVSEITDPVFSAIAAGVIRGAGQHGQLVNIGVTERDPERELDLVRVARQHRPSAIILAGSRRSPDLTRTALVDELRAMSAMGTRVVAIGQDTLPIAHVCFDNVGSGRDLARYLCSAGYRRPVILAGPSTLDIARERLQGVIEGFQWVGVEITSRDIVQSGFARADGESAMRSLIRDGWVGGESPRADVVIAVNDVMAIGALAALRNAGVKVPGDVGVAGFDDIAPARDAYPPLTTVRLPLEEAGERAVGLAVSFDTALSRVELSCAVLPRASTRVISR